MGATRRPITVADLANKAKSDAKATRSAPKPEPRSARRRSQAKPSAKTAYRFVADSYRPDTGTRSGTGSSRRATARRRLHLVRQAKELMRLVRDVLRALQSEGPAASLRVAVRKLMRWLSQRIQ